MFGVSSFPKVIFSTIFSLAFNIRGYWVPMNNFSPSSTSSKLWSNSLLQYICLVTLILIHHYLELDPIRFTSKTTIQRSMYVPLFRLVCCFFFNFLHSKDLWSTQSHLNHFLENFFLLIPPLDPTLEDLGSFYFKFYPCSITLVLTVEWTFFCRSSGCLRWCEVWQWISWHSSPFTCVSGSSWSPSNWMEASQWRRPLRKFHSVSCLLSESHARSLEPPALGWS